MGHSIGAEELAALTTHGDDRILEQAEVVLGVGVALPVAERAEVLGADMRDAGGVPDDLDVVCALLPCAGFLPSAGVAEVPSIRAAVSTAPSSR